MVHLRLKSNDSGTLVYEYMPERKDAYPGLISIDAKTKKKELLQPSRDDVGNLYLSKAAKALVKMLDDGRIEHELYYGWY